VWELLAWGVADHNLGSDLCQMTALDSATVIKEFHRPPTGESDVGIEASKLHGEEALTETGVHPIHSDTPVNTSTITR
jgi:hypothetical protein